MRKKGAERHSALRRRTGRPHSLIAVIGGTQTEDEEESGRAPLGPTPPDEPPTFPHFGYRQNRD
ncbi:MAG: hypothetical protein ABSF71_08795 [Terriglobia bacterium]|jgi:hypothetical protein